MACSTTGIKIEPAKVFWGGVDLGYTDGDISIAKSDEAFEVTAHQSGTQLLDVFLTSQNISVDVTLKETTKANLETVLGWTGGTTTADAEVSTVECSADVSLSLQNKYFYLYSANDAVKYYVWYNVNAAGVDPAPSGATGIEVAIATNATASAVALATKTAVDSLAAFVATNSGAIVTITNASNGPTTDIYDFNTDFEFCVTTQGCSAVVGLGTSIQGTSLISLSKPLVFHPVRLDDTDSSEDIIIFKTFPLFQSIDISGENPRLVPVTFRAFRDSSRQAVGDLMAIGVNK